jgi:hypothetical protein
MNRLGSYIFFLTLVLHTFSQVMIIGQFAINQEFIAAELCENKDEPELECNGKCYLAKELKKDEERKHDDQVSKVEVLLFCESKIVSVDSIPVFHVDKSENSVYLNRLSEGHYNDVFHPPCG